jgi:hypothetical protein
VTFNASKCARLEDGAEGRPPSLFSPFQVPRGNESDNPLSKEGHEKPSKCHEDVHFAVGNGRCEGEEMKTCNSLCGLHAREWVDTDNVQGGHIVDQEY